MTQLHALIIGVSHYPHLPGGKGNLATETFGLGQLTSPALSAFRFAEQLRNLDLHQPTRQLPMELGSVRILLSPSDEEEKEILKLTGANFPPATLDSVQDAAREWRDEARRDPSSGTLFLFAGHGMQWFADTILLLQDFGNPRGGTFSKTVAVRNIYDGMAPEPPANPPLPNANIARTQWYFVDACRVYPKGTQQPTSHDSPSSVLSRAQPGLDDRRAPIFFSALPGGKAQAMDLAETVFTAALFRCLNGAGGECVIDPNFVEAWQVSAHSLCRAMTAVMADLQLDRAVRQECRVDGQVPDAVLCHLDGPPTIDVVVQVDPSAACPLVRVVVEPDGGGAETVFTRLDVPVPHHRCNLPLGKYQLAARVGPPPVPPYQDFPPRLLPVEPPIVPRRVRV
jgi:hypothetical protein